MNKSSTTRIIPSAYANAELNGLYQIMLTARLIDEMEAELVARAEAFFHVSGAGHESSAALNPFLVPEDYLHLHYRDKALMLARGVPIDQFFHSCLCNGASHSCGRQMSAHMSAPRLRILSLVGPVGNNALQSVGIASHIKKQNAGSIVVCSIGDGTSQQGEVYEAIAEAARSRLPILFLIQDNRYSISTNTTGKTFFSRSNGDPDEFFGLAIHRVPGRQPTACGSEFEKLVKIVRGGEPIIAIMEVERLSDHTNADDERQYRSEMELRAAGETGDPIRNLASYLTEAGVSSADLQALHAHVRTEVRSAAERALADRHPSPTKEAKKPLPDFLTSIEVVPSDDTPPSLTMLEAIREVLGHHLASDPRVTLFGEDIEDPKGDVFGVTRGLSKRFPERVINSALSESTIVGMSVGRALAGGRPVAFIQFADFLPLAYNQIISELGSMFWRTAGGWECPVIIMAACGGYRPGLGPFHAQTMEATMAHVPGIDVYMPSTAADAAGLLNSAFGSGRPSVFLYPKVCLNAREDLASPATITRPLPIGKCRFLSRGSDLTIVTWGSTVPICARVLEPLRKLHLSVDLIDLRSISPWDHEAVATSVAKTGRLLVVHEDNLTAGFGAEVVATIVESIDKHILVQRVARPDTFIPCKFANQLQILPSYKRVLGAVADLLDLELEWHFKDVVQDGIETVNAVGASPADRTVMIVNWRVTTGQTVNAGDIIADIEADKAVSDLACPVSGVVREFLMRAGDSVPVGSPILKLRRFNENTRVRQTLIEQRGEPSLKRRHNQRAKSHSIVSIDGQPRVGKPSIFNLARKLLNDLRPPGISPVGMSVPYSTEGSITITNDILAARFPMRSADEIARLTGIMSRRYVARDETVLDLARHAATKALAAEGLGIGDLDAIFCSTSTPVNVTPSLACALLAEICPDSDGPKLLACDISAACSGYLYALSAAFDFLQTRPEATLMVVTAEAMSTIVDPGNFDTAILFGDAATATLLYGESNPHPLRARLHRPIVSAKPDRDGSLRVPNAGRGFVEMKGKRVFTEAVRAMVEMLDQACAQSNLKLADLHRIVPHQGNGRIIEAVRARLGAVAGKVVNDIESRGNTSSSTIPLCLGDMASQMTDGQYVGLCSFGGGFTFGAAIMEIVTPRKEMR